MGRIHRDGTAGLTVAGFGSESLRSRLGVEGRLDGSTLGIEGVTVTGRAAWSHELASPSSSLRVSLLGSDTFEVEGQSLPRNLAEAGLSLDAVLRNGVRLFAAHEG
ncbi:autotransporter outer membrane beta-barrel domain-containing protein [Fodinicurvata sp. EGI_FJ10296]|uniref:autotransporter outer membrane beta-barrel domain-containing protein n=1 Tax=Fodinicurvata sp. EGI_FJ10296 TaxID=3231908 RepID=UPI0034558C67